LWGGNNYVEVETVKLDDYFENKNFKVDLIKMDIEGAEGLALEGMQEILKENKDIKILSEFTPGALIKTGISAENFLNNLANMGFSMYEIIERVDKINLKKVYPLQFTKFVLQIIGNTNIFCKRE